MGDSSPALRSLVSELVLEDHAGLQRLARKYRSQRERDELNEIGFFEDFYTSDNPRHIEARELKRRWRAEADLASFSTVQFVHWGLWTDIVRVVVHRRSRDELSTVPYPAGEQMVPLELAGGARALLGLVVKGTVTFVSRADLQSGRATSRAVNRKRADSSGWNKYPGVASPGVKGSLSWENAIVLSADELRGRDVNYDPFTTFYGGDSRSWPEALIDNWRAVAIVVPNNFSGAFEDSVLDLHRTSGLPVVTETGEGWSTLGPGGEQIFADGG